MPQLRIIALGAKQPDWVNSAVKSYLMRIPNHYFDVKLVEIPAIKRGVTSNIKNIVTAESEKTLAAIPENFRHISLDRNGKAISSQRIAEHMQGWMDESQNIAFSIGGPEGFPSSHFQQCYQVWSMSKLTLAHPVVRVVLCEQLYRAYTILTGHPYHRGECF